MGTASIIDGRSIAELATHFSGELLLSGDAGYDEARRVHNGLIDKRPALIARCLGTADVVDAVNFARARGIEVAIRGGGHNVAGKAVCDGGLMIDLSRMKGIHVDPAITEGHPGYEESGESEISPNQRFTDEKTS